MAYFYTMSADAIGITRWRKALPQVCFWLAITLLFLYERRYLIEKAGLPNFVACVLVRLALLAGLAYLNLCVLIPRLFKKQRYYLFGGLVLISIGVYIALQSAYDMFLFGFIIGDMRYGRFWFILPYNAASAAWYLLITAAFKISLGRLTTKNMTDTSAIPVTVNPETPEFIYLKSGLKTVKIFINEILYIQALKDYSVVYTPREKIVAKGSLKYLEQTIPAGDFVRVHKSYIVARNKIISVQRTRVLLSPQISIPVGRSYLDRLKSF